MVVSASGALTIYGIKVFKTRAIMGNKNHKRSPDLNNPNERHKRSPDLNNPQVDVLINIIGNYNFQCFKLAQIIRSFTLWYQLLL